MYEKRIAVVLYITANTINISQNCKVFARVIDMCSEKGHNMLCKKVATT